MANLKDLAGMAMDGAGRFASGIKQKNRRAAMANRLRTVIRCQERAAEKEYLALGRYYYNALRNKEDQVAEDHCKRLDEINALLDSTLESLEKSVREQEDAASGIRIIGGEDGPTAVRVKEPKKDGTIFHFGGGPLEITVKRDVPYRPEEDESLESEEIDLSDVESFDHDLMPEEAPASEPAPAPVTGAPAELDENDSLPFEG